MMKRILTVVLVLASIAMCDYRSIYDIQYTTAADGNSPEAGNIVDCNGIVVYVTTRYMPKVILYDGENNEGWGGIIVKDWIGDLSGSVNVGDKVRINSAKVEDFRGTTFLQYKTDYSSFYTPISSGNALPEVIPLRTGQIEAPVENPTDVWAVTDRNAEKYEGMFVKVIDVNVTGKGYGKALDNYSLQSNVDANMCWASDFLNEGLGSDDYHDLVQIGQNFCGVTGFVEQYNRTNDGIYFDYYQIITTTTEDFVIEQAGDLNGDCAVDFRDFALISENWLEGTYWN